MYINKPKVRLQIYKFIFSLMLRTTNWKKSIYTCRWGCELKENCMFCGWDYIVKTRGPLYVLIHYIDSNKYHRMLYNNNVLKYLESGDSRRLPSWESTWILIKN